MGNYPYASSYIIPGHGAILPPWPVRAACAHLDGIDAQTAGAPARVVLFNNPSVVLERPHEKYE